jgi:hypothetical protein
MHNQLLLGVQTAFVLPRHSEQPLLRNCQPSTWRPLTATKPQQVQLLLRVVRLPPDGTSLWNCVEKKTSLINVGDGKSIRVPMIKTAGLFVIQFGVDLYTFKPQRSHTWYESQSSL